MSFSGNTLEKDKDSSHTIFLLLFCAFLMRTSFFQQNKSAKLDFLLAYSFGGVRQVVRKSMRSSRVQTPGSKSVSATTDHRCQQDGREASKLAEICLDLIMQSRLTDM